MKNSQSSPFHPNAFPGDGKKLSKKRRTLLNLQVPGINSPTTSNSHENNQNVYNDDSQTSQQAVIFNENNDNSLFPEKNVHQDISSELNSFDDVNDAAPVFSHSFEKHQEMCETLEEQEDILEENNEQYFDELEETVDDDIFIDSFDDSQESEISSSETTGSQPSSSIQYPSFWKNLQHENLTIPDKTLETFSKESGMTVLELLIDLLNKMLKHRNAHACLEDDLIEFKKIFPKSKIPTTFDTIENYLSEMGLRIETIFVNSEGNYFFDNPTNQTCKEIHYFPITRVLNIIRKYSNLENFVFRTIEELKQVFQYGSFFEKFLEENLPLMLFQVGTDGLTVYSSVVSEKTEAWPFLGKFLGHEEKGTIDKFFTLSVASFRDHPETIGLTFLLISN